MSKALVRARAFFLVALVWAAVGFSLGFLRPFDRSLGIELPSWVRVPAVVLISGGGSLMMVCGLMLSTAGIGSLPDKDRLLPREFIAYGPFRFVRNPMSLGGVILIVGLALWHRSTLALAAATVVFLVLHLVAVLREEPGLKRRFGDDYCQYLSNVPRWIPRLNPWSAEQPSEVNSN